MTDYEVWMELATHMEGSGCMPDLGACYASGLCHSLEDMKFAKIISPAQFSRLTKQLHTKFSYMAFNYTYDNCYWPPGEVAPRIKACKLLAEECKHAPR